MAPLNGAGHGDGQDPGWRFSDMMQVRGFVALLSTVARAPDRLRLLLPCMCCRCRSLPTSLCHFLAKLRHKLCVVSCEHGA